VRIRSLEISGFKSFGERAKLAFERGVSAIVGPNGCGKSNVVDAIRWVMGEQNPRKLRGRLMDDLIFSGTETLAPVGVAEVALTFDNTDGLAPAPYREYGEIEIARRLYRSGESEYLLNKVPVRLRDVLDFFLDTGIGTRGYTIVEQGAIAGIVSSKPEDRRTIFEEAAGIGKYRQRRRETESKLASTEQNLLRVQDILAELRRQQQSLDRQAQRASRYKKLLARVRELELLVAHEEHQIAAARSRELARESDQARAETVRLDAEVASTEAELESERRGLLDRERELDRSSQTLFTLRSEIQGLEGRAEFERREREGLLRLAADREGEIGELEEQHRGYLRELSEAVRELASADARITADQAELESAEARLRSALAEQATRQGRREALQARLVSLSAEAATLASRGEALSERRSEIEARLRQQEEQLEANAVEVDGLLREEEAVEARLQRALGEKDELGRRLAELIRARGELGEALETRRAQLAGVSERIQQATARLEALREAEARESHRVAQLLEALPEGPRRRIRALLKDAIHAEDGLELALEAVLEGRLETVLVDDAEGALAVLDAFRKGSAGRATIAALAAPRTAQPRTGFVPLGRPLLLGVRCDEAFRPLVERLLDGVQLVDSLREPIERYGAAELPAAFVTPAGEVLDRSGLLTGGAAAPAGALSRAGEIGRLEEACQAAQLEKDELEVRLGAEVARQRELGLELENARNRLHTGELAVVNLERDLERARERGKAAFESSEDLRSGRERLLSEIERLTTQSAEIDRRLAALGEDRAALERDREGLRQEIAEHARELERQERAQVQARVELAGLCSRRDQLGESERRLEQQAGEAQDWVQRRREEVAEARARALELERSAEAAARELRQRLEAEEAERARQEGLRGGFEQARVRVEALEGMLRTRLRSREEARERLSAGELLAQEVRMRLEQLKQAMLERHKVDLEGYRPSDDDLAGDAPSRESELAQLREGLDALGAVNLGSIEEYEEVSERFRYLSQQRDDLLASVEKLKSAIARINRTSRARFRETFEAVDRKFQEIFPRMFRGGRAYLSLTDADDVLEAGIEITAMPPGKKLVNVNLLSGGEKSLTAISLLMAVFAVKPAPFFLLDEVDAALDDANVARFDELVREMSAHSQFLVITHNKASIESADRLFGVTMEQPGLSKLVQVDLIENGRLS
jgi:chromosome segregation protein